MGLRIVGRDRELAAMAGWLDDAAAGRGSFALVCGEPGIGKTRFLETAAARAEERGFAVTWGRAWEVSSAPPYWPWIEALRGLLARPGGRGGADALVAVLPELDRRGAPAAADADGFALHEAVLAYLHAAAGREPIAIVLDDLHAADPSSLRLAEVVAPRLRAMRALLLASCRDVEARRTPAIEDAIARLGRRGEVVALPRLALDAVGALVAAATGRADPEAARMIHGASDGNPLFVRELLGLLTQRGAAAGDVPAGVRAVIRERLALLSPATVALLQAAAVVGRSFGVALAAAVAGVSAVALEDAIADAVAADVVQLEEPGRYRCSHALVAETLAGGATPVVRARLHRRAAEALAALHAGDPSAPLAAIARHWLAVGPDGAGEALAALERAAAQAEDRLAFADAAALHEEALGVLARSAPGDVRRRVELLIAQGQALVRGGERDRARAPCVTACQLAASLGDGVLRARAALAYGADVAVATVDPTLVRLLEEAREQLPPGDDPWQARVMARLAAARQPAEDGDLPIALAHEAIAMARRLGGPRLLGDVAFAAIGALTDFERPEVRAPLNAEVARLAATTGDRARQLRSLQRLAFDRLDLGDLIGFERTVAEYEAIGADSGQARYRWPPILFRAMQAAWQGRIEDGDRLAAEAFAIREQLGEEVAALRRIRHDMIHGVPPERLAETARMMAAGYPPIGHAFTAREHVRAGRLDEARASLALSGYLVAGIEQLDLHGAGIIAEVVWALRERGPAATLYERLAREHGRPMMITSMGFLFEGVFDHARMRMAGLLGRLDDVERLAVDALALCDRIGAVPLAALVRADLATLRDELGGGRVGPATTTTTAPATTAAPAPAVASPIAMHRGRVLDGRRPGRAVPDQGQPRRTHAGATVRHAGPRPARARAQRLARRRRDRRRRRRRRPRRRGPRRVPRAHAAAARRPRRGGGGQPARPPRAPGGRAGGVERAACRRLRPRWPRPSDRRRRRARALQRAPPARRHHAADRRRVSGARTAPRARRPYRRHLHLRSGPVRDGTAIGGRSRTSREGWRT
jgi:hypothetical protein